MAKRKIIELALNIDELNTSLVNIATDDKKYITDYTDAEIVAEAKYVLSTFNEGGHNNNSLTDEYTKDEVKWAKSEVRKLNNLIKRFG